ncbi:ABC transporter substrate-binding protein [Neorhizobium sp. NCHU2750]|uniref:ABC transporter substrate-binding protein n=1 Tax=Neorhizobium sp. NCHU2750 TaxID=1825976 RepID=UPI0013C47D0B
MTDIKDREVTMPAPATRILLASSFQYPALAILDVDAAKRVVGIGANPGETLPEAERDLSDTPRVGSIWSQSFSIEKTLELRPDVVIAAPLSPVWSQKLETVLSKAGIPIVYVDFDENPFRNTDRSFEILGRVLGAQDKASEFIDFYHQHVRAITERMARPELVRPTLLMMLRGPGVPCCLALPANDVTDYFGATGVENIAGVTNGAPVQLSLESIIERDPDIFVVIDVFSDARSLFGLPRTLAHGMAALKTLRQEPGLGGIAAMRSGRVHALDSYLMRSPLSFLSFEALAKWIQPELFADVDPQATLDEINRRFLKTPLRGPFWTSFDPTIDRMPGGNQ